MFTGLVQAKGRIASIEAVAAGSQFWVEAGELAHGAALGDSVAVNGCCLTVDQIDGARLRFCAIPETLRRTSLGDRGVGASVNLELPLRPADRLGGHFVQGHVDNTTEFLGREGGDDEAIFRFALPTELRGHVVEKGSIAIEGVSLTVASVDDATFTVALIPHTLEVTSLGTLEAGARVNLEGDILAKYVASLLKVQA